MDATDIIIVAGPTASGKSALAVRLAQELNGAVINADSMQVYRDLPILTAQPDAATQALAPHVLYGAIDAAERFSVGAWRARALAAIASARGEGLRPILVGGTGLYFRALLEGLAETPPIPDAVTDAARALHAALGAPGFHARLAALDPEAAKKLPAGDTQRVLRAYAVAIGTGKPLTLWQREQVAVPPGNANVILVIPSRLPLYAACDARFLAMMESGAITEIDRLAARALDPALPAMRALGVPALLRQRRGEITLPATVAAAQQSTRNYAKRQLTWFRHQLPERQGLRKLIVEAQFSERLLPEIFSFIRH